MHLYNLSLKNQPTMTVVDADMQLLRYSAPFKITVLTDFLYNILYNCRNIKGI